MAYVSIDSCINDLASVLHDPKTANWTAITVPLPLEFRLRCYQATDVPIAASFRTEESPVGIVPPHQRILMIDLHHDSGREPVTIYITDPVEVEQLVTQLQEGLLMLRMSPDGPP